MAALAHQIRSIVAGVVQGSALAREAGAMVALERTATASALDHSHEGSSS